MQDKPDFSLETSIGGTIAAIDEVGRGPWAGPVLAVAVIVPRNGLPAGITDSKQLSKRQREQLYQTFMHLHAEGALHFAIGQQGVRAIDTHNILGATHLAMASAFAKLQAAYPGTIDHVLVDGNRLPDLPVAATPVVKGDSRSISIAAASIIAKVVRDRSMADLAERYPGYGWERNAGYGTAEHQAGIRAHGITPHHRLSFAPIRAAFQQQTAERKVPVDA